MKWNDLTMSERSELMKLYLKNDITSLSAMKEHYNSFATGGHLYKDGGPDDDKIFVSSQASEAGWLPEVEINANRPSWQQGLTDYDWSRARQYYSNPDGTLTSQGFEFLKNVASKRRTGQSNFMRDVNKLSYIPNAAVGAVGAIPTAAGLISSAPVVAEAAAPYVVPALKSIFNVKNLVGLGLSMGVATGVDQTISDNSDYKSLPDWANQTFFDGSPETGQVLEFFRPEYMFAPYVPKGVTTINNYVNGVEKRLAETALRQGDVLMRQPITAVKNITKSKNAINYILNPKADPKLAYNLGPWFNYNGTVAFSGPMKMNGKMVVDAPTGYEGDVIDLFLGKNLDKARFPLTSNYPEGINNYTSSRYGIKSPRVYDLGIVDNAANIGQKESMGIFKNGEPVLDPGGHITYGQDGTGTLHYDIWKYNPTDFMERWAVKENMSKPKRIVARAAASFLDKQGTPIAHIWTQPWESGITNDSPLFSINKKFNLNLTEKDLQQVFKDLPTEMH